MSEAIIMTASLTAEPSLWAPIAFRIGCGYPVGASRHVFFLSLAAR